MPDFLGAAELSNRETDSFIFAFPIVAMAGDQRFEMLPNLAQLVFALGARQFS
jgi:hypothetical protein